MQTTTKRHSHVELQERELDILEVIYQLIDEEEKPRNESVSKQKAH